MVTACRRLFREERCKRESQAGAINGGILKLNGIYRKVLPGLRDRDVFITQRIKAVIRAYKEILATDAPVAIKRRPVAYYGACKGIPNLLLILLQGSPSGQRTPVDIQLAALRVSPGEFTPALLLVVAAPAHMIEGEVSNGAPTVRNEYGWLELRHSLNCRSITYAKLRKISEN